MLHTELIKIFTLLILVVRCSLAIDGDLRLQGGNHSYGRLMISLMEEWASVCSDWWKPENSIIACQQLGFELGGMRVQNDEIHPLSNDTKIGLDDVNCEECRNGKCHTNSNLKKLIECRSSEYFDHDCNHSQDVFLSCDPTVHTGDIMLQGHRRFKKILYLHRSRWINVCGLSNWTQKNTNIVCNQLGYYCGKAKMFPLMGNRNQSMAMYDVRCFSLNSRFKDCQYSIPENIGRSVCVDANHLYVYCSSSCSKRLLLEKRNPTLFISSLFNLKPFNSTIELVSKHPFRFMLYPRLHNKSASAGLEVEILLDPEECQGPLNPLRAFYFSSPFFVPITLWNCYRLIIKMNVLQETDYFMYFYEVKMKTVEEATYQFNEKPQNQAFVMGPNTKHQLNCSVYTSIPVQWVFEPVNQGVRVLYFNDQLNSDFYEYYEVQKVDGKRGSRNLIIKKANPNVAGRYYCIENNGSGLNVSADIIVLEHKTKCIAEQNMKVMTINCRARFTGNYAPVLNATEGFVKFQTFTSPVMLNYSISYIAPSYKEVSYLYFNGKDGDIHLAGGNNTYGRLLVKVDGKWVRVCADNWTTTNTLFVCKQLGFSFGGKVVKERRLKEQITVGKEYKIGMFQVECDSTIIPPNLIKCPYEITDYCEDQEDVFVSCNPTHGEVKLIGTKQQYRRLLVSYEGKWSRVCSKEWPEVNTRVACRQMKNFCGLQRYVLKAPKNYIPINIQNIDCESKPYSKTLLDCDYECFNGKSCTFVHEIYLQCLSECKSEVIVKFPKVPKFHEDSSSLFYLFIPSHYNLNPFSFSKTFHFEKKTKFILKPLVAFISEPKKLMVEIILDGKYCKGPLLNANSSFYFSDISFVPLLLWECLEFTIKFTSKEHSGNSVIEYAIFLNQTEAWENMKDRFMIAPKSVAVSKGEFILECKTSSKRPVQWVFTPFQHNQSHSIFFNNQLDPSVKHFEVLTDSHGSYNLKYKGCHNVDLKKIAGNYKCILNNGAGTSSEAEVIILETEITCDPLSTNLFPDQELIVSCQVTFYGKFSPVMDVEPFLPGMQITNASRPTRMFYIVRSPVKTDMKKFTLTITTFFPQLNFYSPIYIKSSKINFNIYDCPTNCSVSYGLNEEDHTVLKCTSTGLGDVIHRWFEQIEEISYINMEPSNENTANNNDKKNTDNSSFNNTKPDDHVQMRWVLVGKEDEIDVQKLVVKRKYKCLVLQKAYVRKSCSCEVDHVHTAGDYIHKLYSPKSIQFYMPKSRQSKRRNFTQQIYLPKDSRLILSPQSALGLEYDDITLKVEYERLYCKGPFNNGKTFFEYHAYPFEALMLWDCNAFNVVFNLTEPHSDQEYMMNISLEYIYDFQSTQIEISRSLAFGVSELSTIAFQCHIEASEDVQWLFKQANSPLSNSIYFNGKTSVNTSFHQITFSEKLKTSFLRLSENSHGHISKVVGTYTCVGENGSGKAASSELIFIEQPTRCFTPNSFLKKNETALINCMAIYHGNFAPIIMVESNLDNFELLNQTDSIVMTYFIRFTAPKVSERITFAIKTYFMEPFWNPPDYHYLITFGFMVE